MLQKQKQKKKKLCFFKAMSVKGTREVVLKEQNTLAIVQGYFFSFFLFSYFFFLQVMSQQQREIHLLKFHSSL